MRFRDDINGVRAISVLAVVLFHFNPSLMPAGFAGVDVFFVISGYLMTGMIVPKVISGTFSLAGFYSGRARRLIPAVMGLCAVLLVWGYFKLLPVDYKQLGEQAVSSMLFFSNIVFYRESGYFDSSSHLKWLLHTWSLSVEWQFYLIYPLMLMLFAKMLGERAIKWGVAILALASFWFAVRASYHHESFAYYMLPSRAWELLLGGLVYLFPVRVPEKIKAPMAAVGLGIIGVSFVCLNSKMAWPGQWALIPVLGVCTILIACCTNTTLAGNKIVSWMGRTSYSTYLWHWPICVYLYSHGIAGDVTAVALGIGGSFALGTISYHVVENVSRKKKITAVRNIAWRGSLGYGVAISVFLLICVSGGAVYATNGASGRMDKEISTLADITNVYKYYDFGKQIRFGVCHSVAREITYANCIEHRKKMIFMWGDSYAAALYRGILDARDSDYTDYGIAQMTDGNGPPFFTAPGKTDDGKTVEQANLNRLEAVQKYKPDVIVLTWLVYGSNAPHDKAQAVLMLKDTVDRIKAVSPASKVVMVGPVPQWGANLNSVVLHYWEEHKEIPPARSNYQLDPEMFSWDKFFKENVPALGVTYISALDVLCDTSGCMTRIGNDITNLPSVDFGHLSKNGSIYLFDRIKAKVFE